LGCLWSFRLLESEESIHLVQTLLSLFYPFLNQELDRTWLALVVKVQLPKRHSHCVYNVTSVVIYQSSFLGGLSLLNGLANFRSLINNLSVEGLLLGLTSNDSLGKLLLLESII
jgi:hypothetical protein